MDHKRWHVSNANQMQGDIEEKKNILTGARGKYRYVNDIDLNEKDGKETNYYA